MVYLALFGISSIVTVYEYFFALLHVGLFGVSGIVTSFFAMLHLRLFGISSVATSYLPTLQSPRAHLYVEGMLLFVSFDINQLSLPSPFYSKMWMKMYYDINIHPMSGACSRKRLRPSCGNEFQPNQRQLLQTVWPILINTDVPISAE